MRILSIDTSTKYLAIGFSDGCKMYEYRLKSGRMHSALIIPSIERIFQALKIPAQKIDYLAVGLGPGSFTGLRIGLSTVKGLAASLDKKVVGVSSLDIIANNVSERLENYSHVCPIIDARRGLVYTCLYRRVGSSLKRTTPYKLISLAELIKIAPKKTVFLGDGLKLYKKELTLKIKQAKFLDEEFYYPKAINIIKLSMEQIKKKKFIKMSKLHPIYLYPKECQVKNA